MKIKSGFLFLLLALLPMLVLVINASMIKDNFLSVIKALGSLYIVAVLVTLFGPKSCFSFGDDRKFVNTIPLLCIVFVVEGLVLMGVDPVLFNKNFDLILGSLGSMLFGYVICGFFAETFKLIDDCED